MKFEYGNITCSSTLFLDADKLTQENDIYDYHLENNYLLLKLRKTVKDSSRGIIEDEEVISLDNHVKKLETKLIQFEFIVINIKSGVFYSSSGRNQFNKIIKTIFRNTNKNIFYEVDIDRLRDIEEIKLYKNYSENLFNDDNLLDTEVTDSIQDIFNGEKPLSEYYGYKMRRDSQFNKSELTSFINKIKSKGLKLKVIGNDNDGNKITVSDIITRSISIREMNQIETLSKMSLPDILKLIKEKDKSEESPFNV